MKSAIASIVVSLCAGDADCLKEMIRLNPSTPQQASNYHDAVQYKIGNGKSTQNEIYNCYLKKGLKVCEKEWKDVDDARFRAYEKKVAACMRGKEGTPEAESKCEWSALRD